MNGLTLAIDTSSNLGRIVIFDEHHIWGHLGLEFPKNHFENLFQRLDFLLRECKLELSQFDYLMAVIGPGSFTGTRIGTVVIKTLAYHFQKPILALSSLLVMVMDGRPGLLEQQDCFCLIPGIRDEIYLGLYRGFSNGIPCTIEETLILQSELPGRIAPDGLVYTRSDKLVSTWTHQTRLRVIRGFPADWTLLLRDVSRFQVELDQFQPLYLRESEAELVHRQQKKKKYQLYIENLWNGI